MVLDVTVANPGDIAIMRQLVRGIAQDNGWPNVFCLRAIAALTAMAEVLYFGQKSRNTEPLRLSVNVYNGNGVEIQALTDFQEVCQNYAEAEWQLERVSNVFSIESDSDGDHIVMQLWMEK